MDIVAKNQARLGNLPRPFPLTPAARQKLFFGVLLTSDALMLSLAFWLAYLVRFELMAYHGLFDLAEYVLLFALSLPAWLVLFAAFQAYSREYLFGGLGEYRQVFNAVTVGILLMIIFGFVQRGGLPISRGWLALAWGLSCLLVGGARFAFRRLVYALRQRGHLLTPAVVVGANEEGKALAQQLSSWATSGLYLVGFIDEQGEQGSEALPGKPVLGDLDELERLVRVCQVQEVIVAPTALNRERLLELFRAFAAYPGVHLRLSSGLFEVVSSGMKVSQLAYVPLLEVNPMRMSGLDMVLKLGLDYLIAIPGTLLALPIFAILALLVRLDSPGPVIHRRRVMGVNGTQFDAFKFRTMYVDGDKLLEGRPELLAELARDFKLKHDPRVTRVGKFLRKLSLDEAPQVFNVLLNQMSLVGPRMISPPEMEKYGKWGMNLLTVKPGITGPWQISGRSDVGYEERVRIDMEYIRNWTIWLDLYVLLRTPIAVIFGRGAY